MRALIQNLRFAFRQLRKSPGFTAVAVLTLALGIGPNVAIFSIVWATFLAPWTYPDADQLVIVWDHYKGERVPATGDDYAQFAAQSHSFQSLSFSSWSVLHLTNADHAPDLEGGLPITPGTNSRTMRQPMLLGRDFLSDEGDPGNDHVVILAHWLWQHRYNSDRNILGKSILINDEPYTVVGVLPAIPHENGGGVEFNVPIRLTPGVHTSQFGAITGRLKPGVTLAQAQAELSVIEKMLREQRGGGQDANAFSLTVEHLRNDWLAPKTQRNLWLLLCAVTLVLLIACANIANLLLARGNSRTPEFAVRSAVGASRSQIFVQLFTESLTLALLGGVLGVTLGWIIMKLSLVYLPSLAIESSETVVRINLPVLGFAFVIALLAGIAGGCAPSWRSTRVNESETLKQGRPSAGGRGRTPLQAGLVIAEIALALILLAGSGLALRSFWNLSHIDLGFRSDHILTAEVWQGDTPKPGSKRTISPPEQVVAQQRQLLERVRALPGVSDAALVSTIPMHGFDMFPFAVAGVPVDHANMPQADFEIVTPSYFGTFDLRLVSGRFLNDEDGLQSPPVVMVNEAFVRRYISGDPLSHQLLLELPAYVSVGGATSKTPVTREYQIVGVLHDVLNNEHLTGTVQPAMYVSRWQTARRFTNIAVRTVAIDPATIVPSLQHAVSSAIPGAAIDHIQTMKEFLDEETSPDRFQMILFGAFAGVALLLSAVGIYGVMSFAVTQRTHEIGVRMALGSPQSDVIRLIVGSGFRMALAGLGIGLVGALVLGRLMRSTLYGVPAADFWSLAAVAVLLLTVALVACWVPARRCAAVDPIVALRYE